MPRFADKFYMLVLVPAFLAFDPFIYLKAPQLIEDRVHIFCLRTSYIEQGKFGSVACQDKEQTTLTGLFTR